MPESRTEAPALAVGRQDTYEARFVGHPLRLLDRRDTFRVSPAGLALGNHLVDHVGPAELAGRLLDVGTGSGAIALLLRALGASMVAATDICGPAVGTARLNEAATFGDTVIDFSCGDLFPPGDPFDLVVFNPPGWRAPSPQVRAGLDGAHPTLDLAAMFYGDAVLARFLTQLPDRLAPGGRAIVGFNSLIGIADVLRRARALSAPDVRLHARVLARHEFPLLFYTPEWAAVREALLAQFEHGRREYGATFVVRDGTLHWFYEITEVTVQRAGAGDARGAQGTRGAR